jgi:hypothetical protein
VPALSATTTGAQSAEASSTFTCISGLQVAANASSGVREQRQENKEAITRRETRLRREDAGTPVRRSLGETAGKAESSTAAL